MRTVLTGADRAGPPTDPVDLAAAYPWPVGRTWTRVAMLRGLDGGVAGADGRSRSISSAEDRSVLGEIRRLSDAIVVGATTLRQEPYGPLVARADAVVDRRQLGLAPAPVLVVVSASLDLPWDEPVFSQSVRPPIVVTVEGGSAVGTVPDHLEAIALPGTQVSAADVVRALHDRGLRRLVCEGGPGLLALFGAEDVVDEVDLTVSPTMPSLVVGPGPGSLPDTDPRRFELAGLLVHDSFLYARYLRSEPSA